MSFQYQHISERDSQSSILGIFSYCAFCTTSSFALSLLWQPHCKWWLWAVWQTVLKTEHSLHRLQCSQGLMLQPIKAIVNTERSEQVFTGLNQLFVYLYYRYICIFIIPYEYTSVLLSIEQLQKKPGQLIFLIRLKANLMEKRERNPEWMVRKWSWSLWNRFDVVVLKCVFSLGGIWE